jgi:hypothetical protein
MELLTNTHLPPVVAALLFIFAGLIWAVGEASEG